MGDVRLEGRRVLVMGGSVGIGRRIGQALGAAGAHVALASRRKELCAEVARGLTGPAIGLACDVTDEAQCQRAVEETVAGLGGLDDLVYSAGQISLCALADADADLWNARWRPTSWEPRS